MEAQNDFAGASRKFKQSNDVTRLPILNVLHEKGVATLLAMRSRIFTSRANSCA